MGETNIIQIQIPNCSSNYQISKDIYSFLNKQGNHIPISLSSSKKQSGGFTIPSFIGNLFNPTTTQTHSEVEAEIEQAVQKKEVVPTATPSSVVKEEKEEEKEELEEVKKDTTTTTTEEENNNNNNIRLQFQNQTHTIDNIKGTKLYYLYLRNGECARWV